MHVIVTAVMWTLNSIWKTRCPANKQPYILAVRDGCQISRCYDITEYQALAAHSVKKAFDLLYKSFYVFDLQYPQPLEALYGFVDLMHDNTASVANSVSEKFNLLFQ